MDTPVTISPCPTLEAFHLISMIIIKSLRRCSPRRFCADNENIRWPEAMEGDTSEGERRGDDLHHDIAVGGLTSNTLQILKMSSFDISSSLI